jgi:hypothetical protein
MESSIFVDLAMEEIALKFLKRFFSIALEMLFGNLLTGIFKLSSPRDILEGYLVDAPSQ